MRDTETLPAEGFAVVDIETSGFSPTYHRILSVGVVQLETGARVERTWSTLLDPGGDPGPVEVHGLSRERLAGAPRFADVVADLSAALRDRIFVAHNASFDWEFLAVEARRVGRTLPSERRLCTVALSRRLGLDDLLPDLRLPTVAAHWGVALSAHHDALADARATADILRNSLRAAARDGLPLPLVTCGQGTWPRYRVPTYAGEWINPGRYAEGGHLVQGMRVAISGETTAPREELFDRCAQAGLEVKELVNKKTSLVVSNDPRATTAKLERARELGITVVDERTLLRLLATVLPGVSSGVRDRGRVSAAARGGTAAGPLGSSALRAEPAPQGPRIGERDAALREEPAPGPLAGRRILVLGQPYPRAAELRTRIAELGGEAAVNLTPRVTHVMCLNGAADDPRLERARALGLPTMSIAECTSGTAAGVFAEPVRERVVAAMILPRGGAVDLPATPERGSWTVLAAWSFEGARPELDVAAFVLGPDERVVSEDDFVFYNQPSALGGAVALSIDGDAEQSIRVDLDALPPSCVRVRVVAALGGGATFGEVGPIQLALEAPTGAVWLRSTLDAATTERTMLLAELYRRGDRWRARVQGQGYERDLAWLAGQHGVETSA